MPRVLHPLPLLDEAALLSACAAASPPIAAQHAAAVWKAVLRAELDQFHPGYAERLASRLASRQASRAASRQSSRRPSLGSASAVSATPDPPARIEEEQDEELKEAQEQGEEHKQVEPLADATSAEDASTPQHTSLAAQYAAEAAAARNLEVEDDAQLAGLSVFPRSHFAPTEAELADPAGAVHALRQVTPQLVPLLPARMNPLLSDKFSLLTSRLQSFKTSADGSTTKLLIRLQDGQHIESVIMRHKVHDALGRVEQRITLCVSSQVGCAMGCTFCATGTMGLRGNLMAGEILEQLLIANRFERIRNIVFMGMGEPLKNYEAVLSTIRAMTDPSRFGLAPSRITLSTVGIVPRMLDLTRDVPAIQLALSLHAPTQELRQAIVPTAKAYPLEKLIDAADYFIQRTKKRILIEYVLLDGVNASEQEAHQLGQLLKGKEVLINLIPWNSNSAVTAKYRAPSREDSARFQAILINEYQLFTTIRVEMGADIDGACGQLALENQNLTPNNAAAASSAAAAAGSDVAVLSASVVRPRGLEDDTATVSEDLLPAKGCATGGMAGDLEDLAFRGSNDSGGGGTKRPPGAAVIRRRGNHAKAAAASTAAAASSAVDSTSGIVASPSPAPDAAAAAVSSSAAGPDAVSLASDSDDDDERTLAEILAREGIQPRASSLSSATSASVSEAAKREAYLSAQVVQQLKVAEDAPVLNRVAQGRQFLLLFGLAVVGLSMLHDSGLLRKLWPFGGAPASSP